MTSLPEPVAPAKRIDLVARELDDDVVLYDPATGGVICLNLVAGLVWDLCDGSHDRAAITQAIAAMFEKAAEEVADDVRDILQQFAERGLLQ